MSQIDKDYAEMMAVSKASETQRQQAEIAAGGIAPGSGVKVQLKGRMFDGTPYIYGACGGCRTELSTVALDYVWKHCRRSDAVPAELNERLKAKQIQMGLRKAESFVDRLLGRKQPAPNLNNF